MKNAILKCAGLLIAALAICSPAFAQTAAESGGPVAIPWGDWLANSALAVLTIGGAVATWGARQVIVAAPKHIRPLLLALRVEQALSTAIQHGLNQIPGAVRGKSLNLDTGNKVANAAVAYVIAHVPSLVEYFGLQRLTEKILARIEFDEAAAIAPPAATIIATKK